MEGAADALDFEKAVLYRDQLSMLREVQAKQAVYTVQGEADVIAIASQAGMTCVNVLTVRGGRVLGGKNYFPDVDSSEPLSENLSAFITSFYFQVTDDLPAEIILSHEIPDQMAVSEALATHFSSKVIIKTNVREHRAEWLDSATAAFYTGGSALVSWLHSHHRLGYHESHIDDNLAYANRLDQRRRSYQ